jgi:hypothetical protein
MVVEAFVLKHALSLVLGILYDRGEKISDLPFEFPWSLIDQFVSEAPILC